MSVDLNSSELDAGRFDTFIEQLRHEWVTQLAANGQVSVTTNNNQFDYRLNDLYVVAVGARGGQMRALGSDENYNKMKGSDAKLSASALKAALDRNYTGPFDSWSADLRLVILVTSESVKSYTVQAVVRRILKFEVNNAKWNDLKELLTNWDATLTHRGGLRTTPLEVEHYKNAGVSLASVKPFLSKGVVSALGI